MSARAGWVWAAVDQKTGERRALKFLKQADDERAYARLLREARATKTVKHPNIAPVLEVAELPNGQPFLVMDLLSGETLAARIGRGPLTLEDTSTIMLQVVEAVEAAHAMGIVHRDLKPDNVFLLEKTDGVRVLDFGIAKEIQRSADESDASLTATGSMIGTPHYMAPEQIFGDSDIDGRADIWALGVILYECITGKRPTQASGVGQVLKIIATDSIPPLSAAAPEVPVAISDLIARMLTRDRAKRPSLAIVKVALENLEGGRVSASDVPASAGPTLDTHEAPSRPQQRRASPMPWVAGIAIAAGGFGVYAFARSTSSVVETADAAPAIAEGRDAGLQPAPEFAAAPDTDSGVVPQEPAPTMAVRRAPVVAKDAGTAKDAGVSTSTDAGRSANILSHDRT